jgi:triacylglycerol lipase
MKRETLIQAAAQAYTRQPLLDGYTATPVFRGQSQAFVFANDKEIIIAFRGTEGGNPLDWWTDLKFRKRSIPDIPGKWHRGFVTATHQLTLQLLSRVHFTGASRRVYITGHSMGAAMAGVFSAYLTRMDLDKHVYGIALFGSPRFANKEAADWLSQKYKGILHRWTVVGDRVTTVPPAAFGYRHVGENHLLEGPKRTWLDRVRIVTRRVLRFKHHGIKTYIKQMAAR